MSQLSKRHLDSFSHFWTCSSPVCPTHTHRDTQTTLSVAIGRIYAMHAMRSYNIHRIAKKCLYTTMSTTSQMMTDFHKKLNYRRGTARRTVSVEILSTSAQQYKNTFEKKCSKGIILKVTQRQWNFIAAIPCIPRSMHHFLLLVCSNATCTFWFMRKHAVDNTYYISWGMELERFQTAKVAFKVISGHW